VTVKSFNKCCTSNAVDTTDDMLQNGSEEVGDVKSEYEEDKSTDGEDGDSDTLVKVKVDRM
jgi:hypothetical protein